MKYSIEIMILACNESSLVADGICDDSSNVAECAFDGGDCCFGISLYCDDCLCKLPAMHYGKNIFVHKCT